MPQVTVRFPEGLYEDLEDLVTDDEQFTDRSEAVRYAVRRLLQRDREEQRRAVMIEPIGEYEPKDPDEYVEEAWVTAEEFSKWLDGPEEGSE